MIWPRQSDFTARALSSHPMLPLSMVPLLFPAPSPCQDVALLALPSLLWYTLAHPSFCPISSHPRLPSHHPGPCEEVVVQLCC